MVRNAVFRLFCVLIMAISALFISYRAQAAVGIPVQLAETALPAGQAGQVISISAFNEGADITVDVYVVVQLPDGSYVSYDSFSGGIAPWLRSVTLPAGYRLQLTPLVTLPGLGAGTYTVITAFTRPNTIEILYLDQKQFLVFNPLSPGGVSKFGTVFLSEQRVMDATGAVTTAVTAGAGFVGANRDFLFSRQILD